MTSSILLSLLLMWCAHMSTSVQVKKVMVGYQKRKIAKTAMALDAEPENSNYVAVHDLNSIEGKAVQDIVDPVKTKKVEKRVPGGRKEDERRTRKSIDADVMVQSSLVKKAAAPPGNAGSIPGLPGHRGQREPTTARRLSGRAKRSVMQDHQSDMVDFPVIKKVVRSFVYSYSQGLPIPSGPSSENLVKRYAFPPVDGRDGVRSPRFLRSADFASGYGDGLNRRPRPVVGRENIVKRSVADGSEGTRSVPPRPRFQRSADFASGYSYGAHAPFRRSDDHIVYRSANPSVDGHIMMSKRSATGVLQHLPRPRGPSDESGEEMSEESVDTNVEGNERFYKRGRTARDVHLNVNPVQRERNIILGDDTLSKVGEEGYSKGRNINYKSIFSPWTARKPLADVPFSDSLIRKRRNIASEIDLNVKNALRNRKALYKRSLESGIDIEVKNAFRNRKALYKRSLESGIDLEVKNALRNRKALYKRSLESGIDLELEDRNA